MEIPEALLNLESNCGIYAVWMIFQHYGIQMDIERLKDACQYDEEDGTFGIGLAVALARFGFVVSFHTDTDPNVHEKEQYYYQEAQALDIPIAEALSYQELRQNVESDYFVIVFYDTLDGLGNHSLVYSIDETEISFFDHFDTMSVALFEQQRSAEGICRQALVIDGRQFMQRYS